MSAERRSRNAERQNYTPRAVPRSTSKLVLDILDEQLLMAGEIPLGQLSTVLVNWVPSPG